MGRLARKIKSIKSKITAARTAPVPGATPAAAPVADPAATVKFDRNKALRRTMGLPDVAGGGTQAADASPGAIPPVAEVEQIPTDPAELERKRREAMKSNNAGRTILG